MKEYYSIKRKSMRAYELDIDNGVILGRFHFTVCGEMSDGMKCWYKCDKDGENIDYSAWYSMTRKAGHMVAILEGV